jgi:hypothetical protein
VGPSADLDTEVRGKILSPLPGIEPRSPGRPARSQTLYCLSYPGHEHDVYFLIVLLRVDYKEQLQMYRYETAVTDFRAKQNGHKPLKIQSARDILFLGVVLSFNDNSYPYYMSVHFPT